MEGETSLKCDSSRLDAPQLETPQYPNSTPWLCLAPEGLELIDTISNGPQQPTKHFLRRHPPSAAAHDQRCGRGQLADHHPDVVRSLAAAHNHNMLALQGRESANSVGWLWRALR